MEYYQLGGVGAAISPHIHRDVFERLERYQRRPGRDIELVLGIKPSGSSHLLLTPEEAVGFGQLRSLRSSHASGFVSLSPIVFRDAKELEDKLEDFKPKAGKKNKRGGDTSTLNKQYEGQNLGAERSRVESSRVLYRILRSPLDEHRIDYRKYNLGDTSWTSSLRVFTFCCTTWLADNRGFDDRKRQPKILDVGWSEASLPHLGDEQKSSRHIQLQNHMNMTLGLGIEDKETPEVKEKKKKINARVSYEYGDSETYTPNEVAEKVQSFFADLKSPIILVVHNWDSPREVSVKDVLQFLGVNVGNWSLELRDLLWPTSRRYAPNDPRRRRSASPTPRTDSRRRESSPPPPPRQLAPVYIIDARAMYTNIFGTQDWCMNVSELRGRLGMYEPLGWCAGNECWMLFEVFRRMAERGPIDDQKKEWPKPPEAVHDDQSDYGDESDEE